MAQAIKIDGVWIELGNGVDLVAPYTLEDGEASEARLTAPFVADMSAELKAAFGLRDVVEPAETPDGKVMAGSSLMDIDGQPVRDPVWVDIPPAPIPEAVTQLQFRRALRHFGLYADVMAFVAAQDEETQEAFNFASMIRRDSPLLNAGANGLLGSEAAGQAKLNEVFVYAATVVE